MTLGNLELHIERPLGVEVVSAAKSDMHRAAVFEVGGQLAEHERVPVHGGHERVFDLVVPVLVAQDIVNVVDIVFGAIVESGLVFVPPIGAEIARKLPSFRTFRHTFGLRIQRRDEGG